MRVVLDTNIFISAFLWRGNAKEIFNLVKNNKIQICVTKEILNEFCQVLKYPKFFSKLRLIGKAPEEIINEFLEVVKFYPPKSFRAAIIKEDPSDDKFLSCAMSSGASFIVSGDKHLLSLKKFQGIPILTPSQFLRKLKLNKTS